MKIKFLGAAGFVTGSCYLLTYGKHKFLIDCGMFQGDKEISKLSFEPFAFDPKEIEAVLLTHAHIDHSGLIPKLCKQGFKGKIFCTEATRDLCKLMLEDSAQLQEFETEYDNRHLRKENLPLRKPLYTVKDVLRCNNNFVGVKYDTTTCFLPDACAVFRDAGHILGSAIIEVFIEGKKVVFSGDLGQEHAPIINNPSYIEKADVVVCESTYGSRIHETDVKKNKMLRDIFTKTFKAGGKLIIPAFAVERTQEIIYRLNDMAERNLLPPIPIYVDSPLALKATKVFQEHTENYDQEATDRLAHGDNPFEFKNLHYIQHTEESKALNDYDGPCVIISSSGMCTGGRIKHHLKHHLPDKNTTILFVGYQPKGTLGWKIREGYKMVKIYGEDIKVNAKTISIGAFSAHADKTQLLKWLNYFKNKPQVFFTHGDEEERQGIKKALGRGKLPKLYEEVTI